MEELFARAWSERAGWRPRNEPVLRESEPRDSIDTSSIQRAECNLLHSNYLPYLQLSLLQACKSRGMPGDAKSVVPERIPAYNLGW